MALELTLNNNKTVYYDRDTVERILYKSTGKIIEVFVGHNNISNNNMVHSTATDQLIERISMHMASENAEQNFKYYLVINCNKIDLVNTAYIGYLHYSCKHYQWKFDMLFLTHTKTLREYEYSYLEEKLSKTNIRFMDLEKFLYFNMIEAHISYILEHARLRMKYFILTDFNFEQYKQEFTHIYSQTAEYLTKSHEILLKHSINDYNPFLQTMDHLCTSCNELSVFEENIDYHR